MTDQARYAIYFAPAPGESLFDLGRRWLGRDVVTGEAFAQPVVAGLTADRVHSLTRSARHYGFHATLKAPFSLRDGCAADDLFESVASFAAGFRAFQAPPLTLTSLDGFLALTLARPSPEMSGLCDACVETFEPFRAPMDQGDIDRRLRPDMTGRQRDYLHRWGYPAVFEDFIFHMTLTTRLQEPELTLMADGLRDMTAAACAEPLWIDAIAIFQQQDRHSPFRMMERFSLKT